MNTSCTLEPYFLTAFHCIDYPNDDDSLSNSEINAAENWMFKFCFKKATCNGSDLVTDYTYNKADFCSAWYTTDFALMKLKGGVFQNKNLTWLGWDRTGNIPISTSGIHHPKGDVMKISLDYDAATSISDNGGINNFWQVDFDDGITQHGSSGSPLLDQNNRVVGQLKGGSHLLDTCDWTIRKYGKFHLSWLGGGSNETRLSNWLNPSGTNQIIMDSFRPSDMFISGNTVLCNTANYIINGLPSGFTVSWSINNSNFSITPSGNQCLVTYTGTPQYSVAFLTASVSWSGITSILNKRIVMHGTTLNVTGWQYGGLITPNGIFPDRTFSIPSNKGLITIPDKTSMDELFEEESLPIEFIEDNSLKGPHDPVDLCGYGITEINGGNMVYLNSTRFNGMDISFSGFYSPTSFNHSGNNITFEMPYNSSDYPVVLQAHSDAQCHDFCLTFNVVPLPGAASGSEMIWVNLDGSMLYVTVMADFPSFSATITKIPGGTQVYSNTFYSPQNSFSVNTSTWTSGIYSIRIVANGQTYTKTIYIE